MNIKYTLIGLFFTEKSKIEYHHILIKVNTYYKTLSQKNKEIFILRTLLFIWSTDFNSDPKFDLNNKMKIIISSAFVQITFGLKINTLSKFNHIYITPRSYSYKNNNPLFDGDVNVYTKKINMSWPAIEKGFKIPDDAMNLAIHEFGHCLILENSTRSYLSKIFNDKDFNNWKQHAKIKFKKIKLNKNIVLREYAGTNLMELFSVALEAFFEKPDFFKTNEPKLYLSMVKLFKQDPINKLNPVVK